MEHLACFLILTLQIQLIRSVIGNGSTNDKLYNVIKQEKRTMMFEMLDGGMAQETFCRNSCGVIPSRKDLHKCHCNSECEDFENCCLDYWKSCNSSLERAYKRPTIIQCIHPILRLSHNVTVREDPRNLGYRVVTKCPQTFEKTMMKKSCETQDENNDRVLPFVSGRDGRIYRNRFCALCHGISSYVEWNTTLKCVNDTLMNLVKVKLKAGDMKFTKEERERMLRGCVIRLASPDKIEGKSCGIVKECENKKHEDFRKCKVYKQPIYSLKSPFRPYKNPHCARCNGDSLFTLFANNPFAGMTVKHSSLGVLFDFTKASEIFGFKEFKTERHCQAGEIYDIQLNTCRKRRLSTDVVLGNWTCSYFNETFPNSSEHLTIYNNRTVYVISHSRLYYPGEYIWHKDNVTVCGNVTVSYLETSLRRLEKLYTSAEHYLTIIGLSMSILALIAVLFTYLKFSELRSKLPGKIVINLSFALMLAQIIFLFDMFAELEGKLCVVIAISLQFLYLAAFSWMNVMAFDVSRTFVNKGSRSPSGSRNKVFLLCFIYAWGAPCLITAITIVVDYAEVINVSYGNNYYCWITNPVAIAIFFAAPVVLMLLFNLIALVRVLLSVKAVRKVTKKIRNKSTAAEDVRMCCKLTAIFGITWIISIAAEQHIALRIIYVLFNSLQGVFIMVGFIMTKRVFNMYFKRKGRESFSASTPNATRRSTVSRKTSSAPLVRRAKLEKCRERPEETTANLDDEQSMKARLVCYLKGPETRL